MSTTQQPATFADTTFIYGLRDPRTRELRYIGKANRPAVRRYQHVETRGLHRKTHKNHWIKQLRLEGVRPELFVIEEVATDRWQEKERYWIRYFKSIGANLTNLTDGGEGGCSPEGRAKQAAALRGRKATRSPEHLAKIIQINKERAKDPAWRAKISASAKARVLLNKPLFMANLELAWCAPKRKRYDCLCVGCGGTFVANNTRRKYCGKTCYMRTWKRRHRCLALAK